MAMNESPVIPQGAAPGWWADLRCAATFLTRLPLPDPGPFTPGGLARSMRCFPLVGALVGGLGGLVALAALAVLPPLVAALLAVAAQIAATGALHEDGLADLADGLGARGDVDRRLAVMRESSNGTFGGLALIFSVALRAAALAALAGPAAMVTALVAAGAVSRGVIPLVMRTMPPARPDGLGAGAGTPSRATAGTALLFAGLFVLPLGALGGVAAMAAGLAAMALVGGLARRRLGGYTGDVLGAVQQAAEIAVLLAVAAAV
jgi:adenosylcobinamide-GDP ribazoletransferase